MSSNGPTHAEQQIVDVLNEHSGSVDLAARELGVSPRYIRKVKTLYWQPPNPELAAIVAVAPAPPKVVDEDNAPMLVSPDIVGVTNLRTDIIKHLTEVVQAHELKPQVAVKLLEVLLVYENTLRASMAPNISIINDNRKQTVQVTQLVNELESRLSKEQLRIAAGVTAPLDIIEGEFNAEKDNFHPDA